MSQGQLRVAIPALAGQLPPSTGTGKMWHCVLPALRRAVDVRLVEDTRRMPGGWKPDVWLSDGHQGPLPVSAPTVVQLHEASWDQPDLREMFEPDFLAAYEQPSADAARSATMVLTPSGSSRDQIVRAYGVDNAKVHVVPFGVDAALFRPGRRRPRALLADAGYDPDRPYVVYVSVIHPRKNLEALREAMSILARRGLPHGLVLVASSAHDRRDRAELDARAVAELPDAPGRVVRLTGLSEPALASVVAAADAFCLPSLMEGFGLTALEAMACGVPVVVSDRGALPEVVGDAGIVTEPTADAVAHQLELVLTDRGAAHRLADAGRRRALELSWTATARGWLAALRAAAVAQPSA